MEPCRFLRRFLRQYLFAAALAAGPACATEPGNTPVNNADNPTSGNAAPPRTIVLAADTWCPVNCNAGDELPGYAVDVARAAFALAGWTLEYRVLPWERALDSGRAGRIDGIIGTTTANSPDFVFPQEIIGRNTNVFFVRADSTWRYRGIRSLDQVNVGIANEYMFGDPFDTWVTRNRKNAQRVTILYALSPVPQGLKLLLAGRIDAYLDDRVMVNWAQRQNPEFATVRESGQLSDIPLYIAFSPARTDAREVAAAFDRGVRELRQQGKLAPILARYGIRDWVATGAEP